MKEKLISEKWLSDYLDGYDVGASVKGDSGAFTMLNNFRVALMEAPAVDAVEVVRCRDCRFSKPAANNDYIVCEIMECYCGLMKDDFCVCGKRREENAVD